ncbi:metal-dependent hydrolase [Phycisphaerales bacterium AB-hyl4]|uniref:Metal-dependent hydrolase n=1 Tax=Natronomicrosphaera hydrolytica TaxID=3242702 RepID=A0ABV4U7Z0_9BACT
MPSPIAHVGLAFFARPFLARHPAAHALSRPRRWAFYALISFALIAPDLDFALAFIFTHPLHDHGTYMHSLFAAILFAPLFAFIAYPLLQRSIPRLTLALVGFAAYSSHLLLDLFTPGRGIMLAWPVTTERFASPVPLFFGAHHSQLWAFHLHLITLLTELIFVALVGLTAHYLSPRPHQPPKQRPTSQRNSEFPSLPSTRNQKPKTRNP